MACPKPTSAELRAAASFLHLISDEELADRVQACHKVARWLISQATSGDGRNAAKTKEKKHESHC